jgi:hypothetical protein
MYFKKVEEFFALSANMSIVFKLAQLMPERANVIGKIFFGINAMRAFINTHILPLISNKRLSEIPAIWIRNRLHPIIEQRQQTPTSRVDVLQLMLQVMTEEPIKVSKINQID